MRKSTVLIFLTIGLVAATGGARKAAGRPPRISGFEALRIAHAGGGLDNKTYTNSYEALNRSLEKGFLYFELDFVFTSDGKLVCLHDWQDNFKEIFGFAVEQRLTFKEFKDLTEKKAEFTNCTLEGLRAWMRDNPAAYIVTDVKDDNLKALRMICKTLPQARVKVIPQIYDPADFRKVKAMGFKQVIWTLYRFRGSNEEVLQWTEKFSGPVAVTMPRYRAVTALPVELKKRQIPTYVYTVNDDKELKALVDMFSVTEVYTDFLQP